MSKKDEGIHWKQMGGSIFLGIAMIVFFSCYPKATAQGIEVAGYAGVTAVIILIFIAGYLNWWPARQNKLTNQTETEDMPVELKKKPAPNVPFQKYPRHFFFEILTYITIVLLLCALILLSRSPVHTRLQHAGQLTAQKDALKQVLGAGIASLYCAWKLFWGIREQRTRLRYFKNITRLESPWNYWVAIGVWILLTAGFIACFILNSTEITFG